MALKVAYVKQWGGWFCGELVHLGSLEIISEPMDCSPLRKLFIKLVHQALNSYD